MGKLAIRKPKWKFLIPDQYMSMYEETFPRNLIAFLISALPWMVGLACTFGGGPLGLGIPMIALAASINIGWGIFGYTWPRLHWLYGLDHETSSALEWYDGLSKEEKAQLPAGWSDVVREHGHEEYHKQSYHTYTNGVAYNMHETARGVISAYRESKKTKAVQDYRIPVQMQLMKERIDEIQAGIDKRREEDRQIERMK